MIDEAVPRMIGGRRLRQCGLRPALADSEVLTMEVVKECLGREQDSALFASFRRYYPHFFPALRILYRTTFVRQAVELWRRNEHRTAGARAGTTRSDVCHRRQLPLPVCQLTCADRYRRFWSAATFGKDTLVCQTFSGLRVHVRLEWPDVITHFCIALATVHGRFARPGWPVIAPISRLL